MEENNLTMDSTTKNNILPINKLLKIILPLATVLLIWELLYLAINNSYIVPSIPITILKALNMMLDKSFYKAIFIAFSRVIFGLFFGIASGCVLAVLCHYSSIATAIISPLLSIMKATPIACIIVLLWISMTDTQLTVFVVVMMVTPIVWQNVYDAFSSMDKDLNEVSEIFEFSLSKQIRFLIIPTLIKSLIPVIITSIGLAWKSGIAAEIMTNSNIGRLIYNFKNITYDTESVYAWTIMIVSFSIILEKTTSLILRRLKYDS